MFTVGIFTTHIPYIAFVVFYAFFFLFGVNTPAEEEVFADHDKFNIQVQSSEIFADVNASLNFHYASDFEFSAHKIFVESLVKRKLTHQCSLKKVHWQFNLSNSLSNRPPPFFA